MNMRVHEMNDNVDIIVGEALKSEPFPTPRRRIGEIMGCAAHAAGTERHRTRELSRAQRTIEAAVALGARRPVHAIGSEVMQCWLHRAGWIISRSRDGRDLSDAIAEADRYAGGFQAPPRFLSPPPRLRAQSDGAAALAALRAIEKELGA